MTLIFSKFIWMSFWSIIRLKNFVLKIQNSYFFILMKRSFLLWDWSWQLCDCELHRLGHIDRIVTNLHRKKKCALLFLCKDWLTKHTNYTRSCKELPALVNWSELTVIFSLYVLHSCGIYAAGSLLKKLLYKKKNSE